jgi:hypothetical protein
VRSWKVCDVATVVATCVLVSVFPSPAPAQAPRDVTRGEKVRVMHTDPCCRSPQVGRLVSVDLDSVMVRTESNQGGALIALPRGSVRYLEVPYATGTYTLRGGGIGAALGAAIGAIVILKDGCQGDEICGSMKGAFAVGAAAVGAFGGAVAGGLIGTTIRRVRWTRVPLPTRVGLAPSRSGLWVVVGTYRLPEP